MNYFVSAVFVLVLPAVARAQIARFDFQNQLSSTQPAFATVGDVALTLPHQFGGPAADRTLALPLPWNTGGTMTFTVWPSVGQFVDFGHLQWLVAPNTPGVADCVSAVTVFANGLQVGQLNPIPQNTLIDIDLSSLPSLQDQVFPVSFDFVFTGNPAGQSSHEISFLQLTGSACDLAVNSVTPASLPTATSDYFQIIGAGFFDSQGHSKITQVKFGTSVLNPYGGLYGLGTYEVFTQFKLRVRPPPCLPAGTYPIEIRSRCDVRTVQVTLTDPVTPTIAGEDTFPAGGVQCITIHGGTPGPKVLVVFVSPDNTPSVVPGLLDLQIGGGFSIIDTFFAVGDCGTFCIPIQSDKGDSYHFHQGVIWTAANIGLTQPLMTTSVLTTYLY